MRRTLHLLLILLSAWPCYGQDTVQYFWSGALTPTSIHIRARVSASNANVRVQACAVPCEQPPVWSPLSSALDEHDRVAPLVLEGLEPGTLYQYRFELDGTLDNSPQHTGYFRTPVTGPSSFSFVVGSCNGSGAHPVWQAMRARDPLFFLSTGDLHYNDPNSEDVEVHRAPYRDAVLSPTPMNALLHDVPIAYVWDDHDFCGNASDGSAIGRLNAARAYREYVPHYALTDSVSIDQSFTIGRVHFILSDLRSNKSLGAMMSPAQHDRLLNGLLYAKANALLACWVTPLTWNSIAWEENWGCQPFERNMLADALRDLGIADLFMLSGDAHMLAIDDGANADFSTGMNNPAQYPIFQAAAINRSGSYKGGTFNQGGPFPNPDGYRGQFGEVVVDDDGEQVCITFNGWRTDSMSAAISLVNSFSFDRLPGSYSSANTADFDRAQATAIMDVHGLQLRWPGAAGPGTIRLYDNVGHLLYEQRVVWLDGRAELPMTDLARGPIIVRMTHADGATTVRIIAR